MKSTFISTLIVVFISMSCGNRDKVKYHAKSDQKTVIVTLLKNRNHSVQDVANAAFGEKTNFDTAVFEIKDVIGATDKAFSKMEVGKESWGDYEIKENTEVYYFKSGSK